MFFNIIFNPFGTYMDQFFEGSGWKTPEDVSAQDQVPLPILLTARTRNLYCWALKWDVNSLHKNCHDNTSKIRKNTSSKSSKGPFEHHYNVNDKVRDLIHWLDSHSLNTFSGSVWRSCHLSPWRYQAKTRQSYTTCRGIRRCLSTTSIPILALQI